MFKRSEIALFALLTFAAIAVIVINRRIQRLMARNSAIKKQLVDLAFEAVDADDTD